MSQQYRACLVGCGRMGATIDDQFRGNPYRLVTLPWAHAGGFCAAKRTTLVAVSDAVAEKSEQIRSRYNVRRSYTDYREMIEVEQPDIISIATRPATHAEITVYAAEKGVKGIYCEKPLCCSMEEADVMVDVIEKHGVKFNYGTNRRFTRLFWKIRELISNGELGKIQAVMAYCGVGVAQWWHTHTADLLLQMAGDAEIEFVQGTMTAKESDWEGNQLNADPGIAMVYVQFKNEVRGYITAATGYEFEISGSKGKLRTENDGVSCQWRKNSGEWNLLETVEFPDVPHDSATVNCIEDLVSAIETDGDTMGNIQLARRSQEMIFGMIESHRRGGLRVPMPFGNRSLYVGKADW